MLVNLPGPANTIAQRIFTLPNWYWITIEAVAPGSIRFGVSQAEVQNAIGGTIDGIELTPSSPVYQSWWKGPLWMIAEQDGGALVRIVIPGFQPGT